MQPFQLEHSSLTNCTRYMPLALTCRLCSAEIQTAPLVGACLYISLILILIKSEKSDQVACCHDALMAALPAWSSNNP